MLECLLFGLTLSFHWPEPLEAQIALAARKRLKVPQIDWGMCPVGYMQFRLHYSRQET